MVDPQIKTWDYIKWISDWCDRLDLQCNKHSIICKLNCVFFQDIFTSLSLSIIDFDIISFT